MTTVRITDDGSVRGLGDGSVRAVDVDGPAESAVSGSTALTLSVSGAALALGLMVGSTSLGMGASGTLSGGDALAGATSLAFAPTGTLVNAWALQATDAPLTAEQKAAWAAHRQALRDVPEQAGFPDTLDWPIKP